MGLRRIFAGVVLAIAVLATGCSTDKATEASGGTKTASSSGARSESAGGTGASLTWGRCENKLARSANLECATLGVPLDPSDPDGKQIDLRLARQLATGPATDRIGSLVLNPGGPGGSGVEFLAMSSTTFPEELKSRFDLVSFDPRGVGESTPVRCLSDERKEAQLEGDQSPSSDAEVDEMLDDQAEFLKACSKNSRALLTHMSTADVAADLDRIRSALGDKQLTYTGFSYGTSIGAVYATLFPRNVRALVLDGSTDPAGTAEGDTLAQARAFDTVLGRFVEECNNSAGCPLAPDAQSRINRVRERLEKSPITVRSDKGSRSLGADQFDLAIATGLYDTSLWGMVADAVDEISGGGAESLLMLMDRQTGRNDDGTFDNSSDAQTMVNCADAHERPDRSSALESVERIKAAAPYFGTVMAWAMFGCTDWPEAANPVPAISAPDAGPILVIGTKGDPATPYSWAESMAKALSTSTLLTYEGDGHTAFLRGGSCVNDTVTSFLVDLKAPAAGTSCPPAESSVSFEPISEQIVTELLRSGIPEDVARCILRSAMDEVGETRFTQMILGSDTDAVSQLIMAKTLSCVRTKAPN